MKNTVKTLAVLTAFAGFGTTVASCEKGVAEKQLDSLEIASREDINEVRLRMDSAIACGTSDEKLVAFFQETTKELRKNHPSLIVNTEVKSGRNMDGQPKIFRDYNITAKAFPESASYPVYRELYKATGRALD